MGVLTNSHLMEWLALEKPKPGRYMKFRTLLAAAAVWPLAVAAATNYTVVGWNNLGMHCMDSDYSVFSILPPYNTINAQVIQSTTGTNGITSLVTGGFGITYQSVADPSGSINTTSTGKGNFFDHMGTVIGATLPG